MFDPIGNPSLFYLRAALPDDFAFAQALTHANMGGYYQRYHLTWSTQLFFASWQQSENFILETYALQDKPTIAIGMLRITEDGDSLHIRDVQIAEGYRCRGAGTYLLETSHRWACVRGLRELQLRVFADNPAMHLYARLGYRLMGTWPVTQGIIHQMTRLA